MFLDMVASVFDKYLGEQSQTGSKSIVEVLCPETLPDLHECCISFTGNPSQVIRPMRLQCFVIEAVSQLL